MDEETLSKQRVVKIKAVSDTARSAYPDLDRVQRMLALSLEAVKSAAFKEDGTELGDIGAILRKNIMVRDEIANALGTLSTLRAESASARTDAEANLPIVQAEVTGIEEKLAELKSELSVLKALQESEETAAWTAANQAAVPPPVEQPMPVKGDEESTEDYSARILYEAQERCNSESPPLIDSINSCKAQIETLHVQISTGVSTHVTVPGVDAFISDFGDGDALDADRTASYTGSISSFAAIEQRIKDVTPSESALPGIIVQIESLTDLYNTLFDLQNQLYSLAVLVSRCGLPDALDSYYSVWSNVPGMGQENAERMVIQLSQKLTHLRAALSYAGSLSGKFAAATDAWSSGIGSVQADLDENLAAAEAALALLIARAAAWENLLAASPGLVLGHLSPVSDIYPFSADDHNNYFSGRLGYFSEDPGDYTPVLRHSFDMSTYKASMLTALAIPGSAGLDAARGLRADYDALAAAAPAIKDAYDSAWQGYRAAFARVKAYEGSGSLPVYDDWLQAAAYASDLHPVDASAVTDQAVRYRALYNTSYAIRETSLTGGALAGGEDVSEILIWGGLPKMNQLPDPGLDEPENYFPHRIAAVKALIVDGGPMWITLPEDEFNALLSSSENEISSMDLEAFEANDGSQAVLASLRGELEALQIAYYEAHPAPTITVHPAGPMDPVPAGGTVQLSVTAAGDLLTYQWSMATEFNYSLGIYTGIEGAAASTFTTPALFETVWFRVEVRNPGGSVFSDPVRIEISGGSPGVVFTSAGSASAQVGVPFSWTFTTEPAGMIGVDPMASLPPGLTFMTGTLAGIPTADGIWDILVMGPMVPGQPPVQQNFRLTIAPQDDSSQASLADAVSILQVVSGLTPAGSLSNLADVNSDGKIGLAEIIPILQKVAGMR
ncbi:MAG: hypothetical protein JW901_11050 [Dehalococcoidia bacterium]|nr:hypothetical protein [Dehalococcoidia bacterium]